MKPRICWVTSSPMTVKAFLLDQLRALSDSGDVTLLVNADDLSELRQLLPGVAVEHIGIERPIRPLRDLTALLALVRRFRRGRFDLVHSFTPKAGLLAMTAARLVGVPHRLHTFTGQVWATRLGAARRLLRVLDRLLATMTTRPLADSPSQLNFLEREGVIPAGRGEVLAEGSISGVDTERFLPDPAARQAVRQQLGIAEDTLLFLFLGRLNRDKGVLDLAEAFTQFRRSGHQGHLLLVGPDEAGLRPAVEAVCKGERDRLHFVDYTSTPQRFMAAADVFCLPSYREGFGSVVIEAASCGLPAIGSRIYGVTDAIEEERTGLLHDPGDVASLCRCLVRLAAEPALRQRLGQAAAGRARKRFDKGVITAALVDFYRRLGLSLQVDDGGGE